MGVGGVGMNAVQGAVAAGARDVFAIDPVQCKRERAMSSAPRTPSPASRRPLGPINELTWGRMADKTIITVGEIQGEYIAAALSLTGKGGRAVVTGMGSARQHRRQAQPVRAHPAAEGPAGRHLRRRSARGRRSPILLASTSEGQLKLDELVTTTYSLEEVNEGYQDMRDGKNIRGMIVYTDADR